MHDVTTSEGSSCIDCVRLREAYWQAIGEAGRLADLLEIASDANERCALSASFEAAEERRLAARDALMKHEEMHYTGR